MKSERYLVTGGAGFIGSHLCEKLLGEGHQVICLDNFYTGRKKNIADLCDHSQFEYVRHDVTQPFLFEVDKIYNLACPASPVQYQHDPIKTIQTNVLGSLHVLGLAKRTKARVLQASTSEVYGDPLIHPQHESYWGNVNCTGPRACYDEGKRVAETLFTAYAKQNHVDIRIARIFNTYGPRMLIDDGRVVSNFVVQALRGDPITIYGDGQQTRSFCYISDLVDGLICLMQDNVPQQPINLGNPVEFKIEDLAKTVMGLTGSRSKIVYKNLPIDDPKKRQPDIKLAQKYLGWLPAVKLEAGLIPTIEYFQSELGLRFL